MSSKYIVSYEHADCSGGAMYVRSSPNASAAFSGCVGGVQVTSMSVPTTSFIPNEVYMDLEWDSGVTELVIQHTCVWSGTDRGYVYADCQDRVFGFYKDGDCKVPMDAAGTDDAPPATTCTIPNAYSASAKSKIPPKYFKKYENPDCTGAILFADEFTGALAASQDVDPCTDGYQIDFVPPKTDQYIVGKTYMSVTNPYMLFKGTVLDKSCVSYAPDKFVRVDCATRTSLFFNDATCSSGDQEVLYPSKVWGIHCGVLNQTKAGWARNFTGALVGLVLISLAAGGIFAVLYRRNRKSHVNLLLKNSSTSSHPSYHTSGREVVI